MDGVGGPTTLGLDLTSSSIAYGLSLQDFFGSAGIQITIAPRLNPALMIVGNTIASAFVSGTYPDFEGNVVTEGAPAFTVDGVSQLGTYVLLAGDLVGAFTLTLSATGAENVDYISPSVALMPHIVSGIADLTDDVANGPFVISYAGKYVGSGLTVSLSDVGEDVTIDTGLEEITIPANIYSDIFFIAISNASGTVYDSFAVEISAANTAPTATAPSAVTISVPAGGAPVIASSTPSDEGSGIAITVDPVVVFDRDILLGAAGTATIYDSTGTAVFEAFDLATEVGSGPGQIEKTASNAITLHKTANFANSNVYAFQISAGAVTNLSGVPIAAITDTTTLNWTTAAGGATAPAAFTAGQWTLTDLATAGDARIAISALPSNGGSAITDLEYKKDAGAWTSLGGTTTGNYDLGIFTDGVSANILIRAVNAVGNGADSDLKSVTTTAGASMVLVGRNSQAGASANLSTSLTALTGGIDTSPSAGDEIRVVAAASGTADLNMSITALNGGLYTDLADLRADDTRDINFGAAIRISDGTETAVITPGSTTSTRGSAAIVEVWRNVDNATPEDVASVPDTGINSAIATPLPITPATAGARVFAAYAATQPASTSSVPTGPANMTEFTYRASAQSGHSVILGLASEPWVSGAFTPDPWSGVADNTSESWATLTSAAKLA